jgi:acyl-CoA synthetase (AMP-forming)/AMP-acid ligase II
MLYERWRQIASERRDEPALRDFASGRHWTFGELFAAGDGAPNSDSADFNSTNEPVRKPTLQTGFAFPQGHSPEFILSLLAAWRSGKVVCPLEPGHPAPRVSQPPAPCLHLKLTSATTGAARLAAFTAEQLAADAENIIATMGLRSEWPNLGVISMAHSYGFSNLVLPLLLHGIPLILAPSPLPEAVRRAAEGESALTLPAVPAMWRAWQESASIPPAVRLAISAGAPLPLELETTVFQSRGLKLHNFYGSTECGGIAYDTSETPRMDPACVGSPMRNVALSMSDDDCLVVKSRAVGETYWPEPQETLRAGRYQTSDLVELKDGLVFLRGRAGDQINVAGRKVSPEKIEGALLTHPRILECVVFGVPSRDAERTEEIVAVVVSRESEGEIRRFLSETLPAWQTPRHWWFVEAVETDARGKVSRTEWRARFVQRRNNTI